MLVDLIAPVDKRSPTYSQSIYKNEHDGDTLRLNVTQDSDGSAENRTKNSTDIWTLYAQEARKHDHVQLETWNRSLDVLLILVSHAQYCIVG